MLEIKFKQCCRQCKDRDTYTKENILCSGSERTEVITQIGCKHEAVCKEYRENEE